MKLSEIIDVFVTGDWGNESSSVESPHAVSCVRGADIVPIGNNEFGKIPLRYISDRSFQQRLLQVGDIVVEKSGGSPTQSTGRAVYISQSLLSARRNIVCSNFCVAFRVKHGWNSYFVYLYWSHLYNSGVFFNFEGKTSGIKNLQLDTALSTIEIEPYPIEEQIRIADCLFSIEKKLQLNRSINHNLEAMAKQLYDYWFVQFDFPDENGKPYKSSGGKMVWNEKLKREIPEGWNLIFAKDVCPIITGKEDANFSTVYGQYPFFTCAKENLNCDTYAFDGSSILIAGNGDFNVKHYTGKFNAYQRTYVLIPKLEYYACLFFAASSKIRQFKDNSNGSIVKFITKGDIEDIELLESKNSHLYSTLNSLLFSIEQNNQEVVELTKLRDSLLPLLMNGQVSVNYDLSND